MTKEKGLLAMTDKTFIVKTEDKNAPLDDK
jgi:hypothetical protein